MSERGRGEITPLGSCFLLKRPRRPFNLPLSYWFITRRCCFFLLSSLMATPSLSWIRQASSSPGDSPSPPLPPPPLQDPTETQTRQKGDGVQSCLRPLTSVQETMSRLYSNHLLPNQRGSLTPLKVHAMVQRRGTGWAGVERRPARLRMSAGVVELFK